MRLGLLILFCIVTPWISADLDNDGNQTNIENSTIYIDETRRRKDPSPSLLLVDQVESSLLPSTDNVIDNLKENEFQESRSLQITDQSTTPEQTENKPCKDSEFLTSILTVMLDLLRKDVPENMKTSYVLQILKLFLKATPEAAEDYEIMYKINDLLLTLEKYHAKGTNDNQSVLRTTHKDLLSSLGVKSKIIFKYEVPQFHNPNCTAELLSIIKVVQDSILRLVSNPKCKSDTISTELPFVDNIDKLVSNPKLSYLPGANKYSSKSLSNDINTPKLSTVPYDNLLTEGFIPNMPGYVQINPGPGSKLPEDLLGIRPEEKTFISKAPNSKHAYPLSGIDFPESGNESGAKTINIWPFSSNNPHNKGTKKNPYPFNKLPTNSKNSFYTNLPYPVDNYPYYSVSPKVPDKPTNPYDTLPSISPNLNDDLNKPFYLLPDVTGKATNQYISFGKSTPRTPIEADLPSNKPSPFDRDLDSKPGLSLEEFNGSPESASQLPLKITDQDEPSPKPSHEIYSPFQTPSRSWSVHVPEYDNPSQNPNVHYIPSDNSLFSPFHVIGSESNGISLDNEPKPSPAYFPSHKPYHGFSASKIPFHHHSPDLSPKYSTPLDFNGSGDSSLVQIGKDSPKHLPNYYLPGVRPSDYLPLDVTGSGLDVAIQNKTKVHSQFNVNGGDSELAQIGPNRPYAIYEYDIPSKNHPKSYLDADLLSNKSKHSPFEVTEKSSEVQVGSNRLHHIYEFDIPSKRPKPYLEIDSLSKRPTHSQFNVDGQRSGEVQVGPNQLYSANKNNILTKNPRQPYLEKDSSWKQPTYSQFEEIQLSSNKPYSIYEYDISSKKRPNLNLEVNSKLKQLSTLSQFDVTGRGSAEVEISRQPDSVIEHDILLKKPKSFLEMNQFLSKNPTHPQFDVTGTGSGEIQFGPNKLNNVFELDLPSKHPKSYLEKDSSWKTPTYAPFDVTGYGSGEVQIGQNQSSPVFKLSNTYLEVGSKSNIGKKEMEFNVPFNKPTDSPTKVTEGSSDFVRFGEYSPSSYLEVGLPSKEQDSHFGKDVLLTNPTSKPLEDIGSTTSDMYLNHLENKRPKDIPNNYNSLASSSPLVNGVPYLSPKVTRPKHVSNYPYEYYLPPLGPRPLTNANFDSLPEYLSSEDEDLEYLETKKPKNNNASISKLFPNFKNAITNPYNPDIYSVYPSISENQPSDIIPVEYYLPNQGENIEIGSQRPRNLEYIEVPLGSFSPYNKLKYITDGKKSHPYNKQPLGKNYQHELSPTELLSIYSNLLKPNSSLSIFDNPEEEKVVPLVPENFEKKYLPYVTLNSEKKLPNDPNDMLGTNLPDFFSPDKKLLLIIKDNIGVIERKIPKIHFNDIIRGKIQKFKKLMSLQQITVEEYVNIINLYEKLINYIKKLNISNVILKELLISMTNGGNLELQTGNSKEIELTYLVKRPTPLVYQPYYYVKYRLPYLSFLQRMTKLLSRKSQLRMYPLKLYKELIPLSKVSETSPDLENYANKDIFKITFNNGTLVGAKLLKGNDLDMYATLDKLKEINSEFTTEKVYQLIKDLDEKLKNTTEHILVYPKITKPSTYTNNIDKSGLKVESDTLNDHTGIHKIAVQFDKKLVTRDSLVPVVTKLKQVNDLRSNISTYQIKEKSKLSSASNNKTKNNNSYILTIRSPNMFYPPSYLNNLVKPFKKTKLSMLDKSTKDTSENHGTNSYRNAKKIGTDEIVYDYLGFKDISLPSSSYGFLQPLNNNYYKNDDKDNNVEPALLTKTSNSFIEDKLLDATLHANHQRNKSPKIQQLNLGFVPQKHGENIKYVQDFNTINGNGNWEPPKNLKQPNLSPGSKLLAATIQAHNFKAANNPRSHQIYLDSIHFSPQKQISQIVQQSKTDIDNNPNIDYSELVQQSQTNIVDPNTYPSNFIKHSETSFINDPNKYFKHSPSYSTDNQNKPVKLSETNSIENRNTDNSNPIKYSQKYNIVNLTDDNSDFVKHTQSFPIDNPNKYLKNPQTATNDNSNNIIQQLQTLKIAYPNNSQQELQTYNFVNGNNLQKQMQANEIDNSSSVQTQRQTNSINSPYNIQKQMQIQVYNIDNPNNFQPQNHNMKTYSNYNQNNFQTYNAENPNNLLKTKIDNLNLYNANYNLAKNSGNYIVQNPNSYPNYVANNGYRYILNQRFPTLFQQRRQVLPLPRRHLYL